MSIELKIVATLLFMMAYALLFLWSMNRHSDDVPKSLEKFCTFAAIMIILNYAMLPFAVLAYLWRQQ